MIAVGCSFWIAWRADRQLYDDRRSEIKCDMALLDVLRQITGLNKTELRFADKQLKVDEALVELSENACHRRITIWGRHGTIPEDYRKRPRTEIEPEYWDTAIISYKGFLLNEEGCTFGNSGLGVRPYSDLYFSRTQINKMWPQPKARKNLRWPFEIKLQSIIALPPTHPER
jgi:hypothetical protein